MKIVKIIIKLYTVADWLLYVNLDSPDNSYRVLARVLKASYVLLISLAAFFILYLFIFFC